MEFPDFLKSKNVDIDSICYSSLWRSVTNKKKWIYVDEQVLDWIGYYSTNKEYKLRQRYLEILRQYFEEGSDFKDESKSLFIENKDKYNALFPISIKESNRAKYLSVSPNCFKESLMLVANDKAKKVRKYYLTIEEMFLEYCEMQNVSLAEELRKAKESSEIMKRLVVKKVSLERTQYIYIASNDRYAKNNLFKVGFTTNIQGRLNGYQCGRSPEDKMKYLYMMKCVNAKALESYIFTKLESFRYSNELYQIRLSCLIDILKLFETFEIESTEAINGIFEKVYDTSESVDPYEFISLNDEKQERPRDINTKNCLTNEEVNKRLGELGLTLVGDYSGNKEAPVNVKCKSVLGHEYSATLEHLLEVKKGCSLCGKQRILEDVRIYAYDNDLQFIEEFKNFAEFKEKCPGLNHQLWKNIVREERWLTPMDGKIYSILSPLEGKLVIAKSLSEYEAFIINVLQIDYSLMISRTIDTSSVLAIDDSTRSYYVDKSMTQLATRLGLNRKTIAKHLNSSKQYNGFRFMRGNSYLDYSKSN